MTQDLVRKYHLMFSKIKLSALQAIQGIVANGLWRVEIEEGFDFIRDLYIDLSSIYELPVPILIEDGHEWYRPSNETIGLPKASLVSCLHEYRHHMQKYRMQHYDDIEVDARGWSISAFYKALPDHFDRAWRNERIWFLPSYLEGG